MGLDLGRLLSQVVSSGSLPSPRYGLQAVSLGSQLLVTGGSNAGDDYSEVRLRFYSYSTFFHEVLGWDGEKEVWVEKTRLLVGRRYTTAHSHHTAPAPAPSLLILLAPAPAPSPTLEPCDDFSPARYHAVTEVSLEVVVQFCL